MNLVIVDDDELFLWQLKEWCSAHYSVVAFDDPREADEFIEACPDFPDVIISDFNMPGMNGLELVDRARSSIATKFPPVFILSGGDVSPKIQSFKESNPSVPLEFFSKPVVDELFHRLEFLELREWISKEGRMSEIFHRIYERGSTSDGGIRPKDA